MKVNERAITVVGSYAAGLVMKVERLPARGETLLGRGYRVDHGGKGSNQAVGCARLGAKVRFVARVGADTFGEAALRLYGEEGVNVEDVRRTWEAPTGVGFIVVESAGGQNSIVLDPGANELLSARYVSRTERAFEAPAVVLTQLEIPVEAARAALERGRAAGALTVLNPAPVRPLGPEVLASVDVLTPNEVEARVLAGFDAHAGVEPEQAARALIEGGVKQVVVTLGEKGALMVTADSARHVPAVEMPAVDTTGAGDAFNAGLATALASGADLESAVRFAVVTGGLAVTREGVVPALPHRETVLAYYRKVGTPPPAWLAPANRGQRGSAEIKAG
jgi:ribokinase